MIPERRKRQRRIGYDRRWCRDRRVAERRRAVLSVAIDDRSGQDRRKRDRRSSRDRRWGIERRALAHTGRDTPVTFSPEEAEEIRARALEPGVELVCPRCGEPLTIGSPFASRDRTIWELRCRPCRRSVMINGPPDRPPVFGGEGEGK